MHVFIQWRLTLVYDADAVTTNSETAHCSYRRPIETLMTTYLTVSSRNYS
jgi:hypothetical protein